jgi:hypothetical protein
MRLHAIAYALAALSPFLRFATALWRKDARRMAPTPERTQALRSGGFGLFRQDIAADGIRKPPGRTSSVPGPGGDVAAPWLEP